MNRIVEKIDFFTINTLIFNSLFNLVKKSKSKIFYKTDEVSLPLTVNGAFLGKEFVLHDLKIVLIVSNGGFFPYQNEEICNFSIKSKKLALSTLRMFSELEAQKKIALEKQSLNFLNSFNENQNDETGPEDHSKQIVSEIFHHNKIELFSEILNNLKHDISNPLFGISLVSQEIIERLEGDSINEIKETLQGIEQNAQRCHQIIKNFQNVYDPLIGNMTVDLTIVIRDTVLLTKSETRGIKILLENDETEQWTKKIQTNPIIVGQILFNLIINAAQAIKDTPKNEPRGLIKINLNKNENIITIAVCDNGPGIAPQIGAKIFSPFFTTKQTGTGLGLCICKKLIQKIKGNLSYYNNSPMPGVTFSLQLPYEYTNH